MNTYKTICKNSTLEKRYLEYIQNDEVKIVSFDIFDTLVYRKEGLAQNIFKKVGENSFIKKIFNSRTNFVNKRVAAEKQARNNSFKKEEIKLSDIYKELHLSKKEQEKVIKIELKVEEESLFINKQIENWIKEAIKQDKKIIFISDIYFTKKELERLVFKKLKLKIDSKNIFISSQLNLSKATGNIYKKVLDDLKIEASSVLHIGDNFYSDIQMASKHGLKVLPYSSSSYINELIDLESRSAKSLKNIKIKEQAALLSSYSDSKQSFFFTLGAYLFAPILWEFSHWLKEITKQKSINQINFIMREGRVFKNCFEQIDSNMDTNLVYASRKSTFLASLNQSDIKESNFNFYKYKDLNIEDLYSLFELDILDELILDSKSLEIKNLGFYEELEKRVQEDFITRKDELIKNIKTQKRVLKKYLKELDYKKGSAFIDFGGTGTILKTLSEIAKDSTSKNILFYTHEQGVDKLLKTQSFSFFEDFENNKTIELIRRSHQVIELLFNGNETTTLSYKKAKNIEPICDEISFEMEENKNSLAAFEKGINSFFICAKKYKLKANSFRKDDLLNSFERFLDMPLFQEANNISSLYYDKGIGRSFARVIEGNALKIIEKEGKEKFFFNYNSSLNYMLDKIVWPQAELTLYDEMFIRNSKGVLSKTINSQSIEKIVEKLDSLPKVKRVYIYAAGVFFKELISYLNERDIKIEAVFDSRAKLGSFIFEGFEVKALSSENIREDDYIIIASAVFAKEIKQEIKRKLSCNIIDCM